MTNSDNKVKPCNLSFKERADIAVKCLPDAEYKNSLVRLHNDMLNKITELEFFKENRTCAGCWGEIRHCDCLMDNRADSPKEKL